MLITGCILICIGSFVIVMNWCALASWYLRRKHVSWIPLVGGAFAAIGMALLPLPAIRAFWWIPFLIDWGSLPGMTFAVGQAILNRYFRDHTGDR